MKVAAILCLCFLLSRSAGGIGRVLGGVPGQAFGSCRCAGQHMTNECVMHAVEPGQTPGQLIRSLSTTQVYFTTTPPLLLPFFFFCLGQEAEDLSLYDFYKRRGAQGMKDGSPTRRQGNM